MPEYPSIGSLGVVGDGRSLAVLDRDCGVQWFCPGRFDAPPLVWPLLDRQRGGELRVGPVLAATSERHYVGETAVLEYDWRSGDGRVTAHVCMTWPEEPESSQRLLFVVRGMSGASDVEVRFAPRPDFGRERCRPELTAHGVRVTGEGSARLFLQSSLPLDVLDGSVTGQGTVRAGQVFVFCLSCAWTEDQRAPEALEQDEAIELVEKTASKWRYWASAIDWEGPYREAVVRSAITLKTLIYEPSGAVVAAGTTSLPEAVGGVRNWDYRYTWLRDASFTLNALYQLGCRREATRWARWLAETTARHELPLPVMFTVDGGRAPAEQEIDAEGYRGSRPVRIGNAAEEQFQLDVYGEVLDCLTICEVMGDKAMHQEWPSFRRLADFIAKRWREPDRGIWEVRDRSRHFVHSKAMAWLALDRACHIARRRGLGGDLHRWTREAQSLRREVFDRGIGPDGYFVRAYDEEQLDGSLLLLPVVGFVDGREPRTTATVRAVEKELHAPGAGRGLLRRYLLEAGDGLPGTEGCCRTRGSGDFWPGSTPPGPSRAG